MTASLEADEQGFENFVRFETESPRGLRAVGLLTRVVGVLVLGERHCGGGQFHRGGGAAAALVTALSSAHHVRVSEPTDGPP